MRKLPFAAVAAVALLLAGSVQADSLSATRSQPMKESAHTVKLKVRRGVARYTVQRRFHNAGKRHEEARLLIDMAVGAAATGLRIRAGERWFDGELMRRERAARLYEELTGIGPHLPKDPALLSWNWADRLQLNVFPIAPDTTNTVEYTLTAPTRYRDGRYFMSYPMTAGADNLVAPKLSVVGHGEVRVDGRRLKSVDQLPLVPTPQPEWLAEHKPSSSATYVSSSLEVPDDVTVKQVEVAYDVRHTYRGDLLLELLAPDGSWHTLHDRAGGTDNDVRSKKQLKFAKGMAVKGSWRLVISDHAGLDVGSLDGWSLAFKNGEQARTVTAQDTPLFLPDAPGDNARGHATISLKAPVRRPLAARLGRVPAGVDKDITRLEIDVAKPLQPKPKGLAVVFVVDASHSMRQRGIDGQIELARSFVQHVPDARFDMVLYRRHAARLVGRMAPAAQFAAVIDRARKAGKLAPDNGSSLDDGIALAAKALKSEPAPRTIVALNDDLLRPSWRNAAALKAYERVARNTIVHLGVTDFSSGRLHDRRNDSHPLSPLAARRGGVLLQLGGWPGDDKKALDMTTLGLVRPVRIDDFAIEGAKFADASFGDRLEEGVGIREMAIVKDAPVSVVLTGKIWAKRYRKRVRATMPFSRATAAFLFSHDMHGDLTEDEQFRVAMLGRAVSPVTSYLAIEPGVRPSKVGLEGIGLTGVGSGGGGSGHGRLGGRRSPPSPNFHALLQGAVAACKRKHHPAKGWSAKLVIDTTFHEIVDIREPAPSSAMQRCIAEAGWLLQLDPAIPRQRDSASVTFR